MSASGYVTVVLLALLAAVAWVIDGSGQLTAHQQATVLAQDAARVGANSVAAPIVQNGTTDLEPGAARRAALTYLTAAGADGTVTVTADTVTVTVITDYETLFPGFLGLDTLHATATASARLISG